MTLNARGLRIGAAALLTGIVTCATVALATTPEKGTLSKAKPKVSWSGTITSSGLYYELWEQDPAAECPSPACDPYTLTVADEGINVSVTNNMQSENAAGGDPGCGVRIKYPDESYHWSGQSTCGVKKPQTVKISNAKAGDYVIEMVSSHVCCGSEEFKGSAFIPELQAGGPSGPSGPTGPTGPGGPQSPAAPQLTVKAPKASAKKLTKKKKYVITAKSTGRLTKVKATLLKGKKVVARGKLPSLNGTAKITLKLKRVKPGKYKVVVSGKHSGGTVSTGVKLKIKK
jgi:hypothetical protein